MKHQTDSPTPISGQANEATVECNGVPIEALLDTGSTVSTISQHCYSAIFGNIPIYPLEEIISIECANGGSLPYSGYIEADLGLSGMRSFGTVPTLLLVVPDSNYNRRVPLLIGTNFLCPMMDLCKQTMGERYAQKTVLPSAVELSFKCISQAQKEVQRTEGRIAHIKSASSRDNFITPNCSIVVRGKLSKKVLSRPCMAMIHTTPSSCLPDGVEVTPSIVQIDSSTDVISVELSNHSDRRVLIPPSSLVCELQQVQIEDPAVIMCQSHQLGDGQKDEQEERSTFLQQFQLSEDELEGGRLDKIESLLWKYRHIFSEDELDIGKTTSVKHRIELMMLRFNTGIGEYHQPCLKKYKTI